MVILYIFCAVGELFHLYALLGNLLLFFIYTPVCRGSDDASSTSILFVRKKVFDMKIINVSAEVDNSLIHLDLSKDSLFERV